MQVMPDGAAPGQTVLLRIDKPLFKDVSEITVRFGTQAAPVARIVDERTIEVGVPPLDPGVVAVIVELAGKRVGEGEAKIGPCPMKRLFFSMSADSITLVSISPFTGQFDRNANRGRRLSYDVFSAGGQMVYTGAIRHPAFQTVEVPAGGDDAAWRRIPNTEPYWFALKIPNTPGRTVVRIYEVAEGIDLSTAKGRAARSLLGEFQIAK